MIEMLFGTFPCTSELPFTYGKVVLGRKSVIYILYSYPSIPVVEGVPVASSVVLLTVKEQFIMLFRLTRRL